MKNDGLTENTEYLKKIAESLDILASVELAKVIYNDNERSDLLKSFSNTLKEDWIKYEEMVKTRRLEDGEEKQKIVEECHKNRTISSKKVDEFKVKHPLIVSLFYKAKMQYA